MILFVLLLIVVICIAFWIHKRFERVRTQHLEKRLRWIHNHNINNDNFLIADEDQDQEDDGSEGRKNGEEIIDINGNTKTESSATSGERPTLKRKVTKVSQTFDIEFERLGLTLSNGTSILQVRVRFVMLQSWFNGLMLQDTLILTDWLPMFSL